MKLRLKKDLHLWEATGGGNIFRRTEIVKVLKDRGKFRLNTYYMGKYDFRYYVYCKNKDGSEGFYPIPNNIDFEKYFSKL